MTTANSETPSGNPKRKRWLLILLAVIILAALASVAWEVLYGRWHEDTDDAYVNGNVVQITPQIAGTVVSIGADDGDLVRKGQVLVKFDPSDADIALQQAEANLAHTVRQVRGLFSNVDGYQAEVAARKVALAKAEADFKRRQNLANDGAISQEELAHARDALDSATASLTTSEQQLDTNRALVDDTVIASHPDVKAAAAQAAPGLPGRRPRRHRRAGHRLRRQAHRAGRPARAAGRRADGGGAAGPDLDRRQLQGNPAQAHAHRPAGGHPLRPLRQRRELLRHRRQPRRGHRQRLLPAAGAERHRQLDQDRPARAGAHPHRSAEELAKHPLRIGLSMDVNVNLHDQSGPALAQQAPHEAVFSTDVYQEQLASADQLIETPDPGQPGRRQPQHRAALIRLP